MTSLKNYVSRIQKGLKEIFALATFCPFQKNWLQQAKKAILESLLKIRT